MLVTLRVSKVKVSQGIDSKTIKLLLVNHAFNYTKKKKKRKQLLSKLNQWYFNKSTMFEQHFCK